MSQPPFRATVSYLKQDSSVQYLKQDVTTQFLKQGSTTNYFKQNKIIQILVQGIKTIFQ